jgi:hypothetical protein
MKLLYKILSTYFIAYLIFWTLLHEYGAFPMDWVEANFNQAILIWVFFFIIPLGLVVLGMDFFKNAIKDLKTLESNSRAPLYLLLFGLWDLVLGLFYLCFKYYGINIYIMFLANGVILTSVYLTFKSFNITKKLSLKKSKI